MAISKDELKKIIIDIVNDNNGLKSMELIPKLPESVFIYLKSEDICETLDELVSNGDILEIEYSVPNYSYKIKSFYLPKGTEILNK